MSRPKKPGQGKPGREHYARAIVAACLAFGDDPAAALFALESTRGRGRRCMLPAVEAIADAFGISRKVVAAPVGVFAGHALRARAKWGERYERAYLAALAALGVSPPAVGAQAVSAAPPIPTKIATSAAPTPPLIPAKAGTQSASPPEEKPASMTAPSPAAAGSLGRRRSLSSGRPLVGPGGGDERKKENTVQSPAPCIVSSRPPSAAAKPVQRVVTTGAGNGSAQAGIVTAGHGQEARQPSLKAGAARSGAGYSRHEAFAMVPKADPGMAARPYEPEMAGDAELVAKCLRYGGFPRLNLLGGALLLDLNGEPWTGERRPGA